MDKFFAQYSAVIRGTQAEAEQDYDDILVVLNKHRPDLVPLTQRNVPAPGKFVRDRG